MGGKERMASDLTFVQYVVDQLSGAGKISFRKMFGEFAIYCDTKVVALICNNQLFVKATQAGRTFIGEPVEAPPYPGAKPSFLIEDEIENRDWLQKLVSLTASELPVSKPKKPKKSKSPTTKEKNAK
jgi:TfoX/Sxy family transcriptional regulator of competence genes